MNRPAQDLIEAAEQRFGADAFTVSENHGDPSAEPGSATLTFVHPITPGHSIAIVQRGNTFEVRYTDGLPPGPAEVLFVFDDSADRLDAMGQALSFLQAVFDGRVVVYRERLAPLIRLLRKDCSSVLEFSERDGNPGPRKRALLDVYEWKPDGSRTSRT